jgi:hypothetical protein
MAAGKFGSFVGKMVSKAQKEGTRSGPSEVAEKAKLAEVGRMKKTELEKIASNPESDYYMAAKRELKRREDVRTGTEAKGVRAMGREKAASTKDIREAAERSVEEKRMLGMAKGGSVKGFKPCSGCPTPAKCKKAGKCLIKEKAKMPSKGSKKAPEGMLVIPVRLAKSTAKKGKKG